MRASAADQTIHGCWNWWIDSIFLHQLVVSRILETHWSIPELCMSLLPQVWERLSFDRMVTYVCIYLYYIYNFKYIYMINYIYIYIYIWGILRERERERERERKHLQSHPQFTVHSSQFTLVTQPGCNHILEARWGWDFFTTHLFDFQAI